MESTPKHVELFAQNLQAGQDYVARRLWEIAELDASDAAGSTIKFPSQLKALELLGRHCGFFQSAPCQQDREDNNLLDLLSSFQEVKPDDLPEVL